MADVYGTNATKALNTVPPEMVDVCKWGGRMRIFSDTYEASSAASGTDIVCAKLPANAAILPQSLIRFDDLGTGTTMDVAVRDADGNETELIAGVDTATAAGVIDFGAIGYIGTFPYYTTEPVDLIIKLQDAASTGTIKADFVIAID